MNELFCFLLEHPPLRQILELAFLLGTAFLCRSIEERENRLTSRTEVVLSERKTCTLEMRWKELFRMAAIIACSLGVGLGFVNYLHGQSFWEDPFWMEFGVWGIGFIVATWILKRNSARNQFAVSEDAIALLEDLYLFLRKQLGERDGKGVFHFICSLLEEHKIMDFVISISYERKGFPEERGKAIAVSHTSLVDRLHVMEIHIFPKENRDFYVLIKQIEGYSNPLNPWKGRD